MKNSFKENPVLRLSAIFLSLVLLMVVGAIGLFYYVFSIPEPAGLSLASWPATFTENFSHWIHIENKIVTIADKGIEYLEEYGLWLQVMDESGCEIYAIHKPETYPEGYTASELLSIGENEFDDGYTVFYGNSDDGNTSYLIGFPYAVGKKMLYYNGNTVSRLKPLFRTILFVLFLAVICAFLGYVIWLTRQTAKISNGIRSVSLRCHKTLPETGVFRTAFSAINEMDNTLRQSEALGAETERTRREWIANITHDLKTPLSPIKGYGELLSTGDVDGGTAQEYGRIIQRNAQHMEALINDLKLTYQLESGALPFVPQNVRIERYIRECVIDIVNDPAFSMRDIRFESSASEITTKIDPSLLRRAIQNILVNALTHNDESVTVTVKVEPKRDRLAIHISDNGKGIEKEELRQLFSRYYRGTSTTQRTEGSGLGLAIAKQIVTLHGGEIKVESIIRKGTEFIILLPN